MGREVAPTFPGLVAETLLPDKYSGSCRPTVRKWVSEFHFTKDVPVAVTGAELPSKMNGETRAPLWPRLRPFEHRGCLLSLWPH